MIYMFKLHFFRNINLLKSTLKPALNLKLNLFLNELDIKIVVYNIEY